MVARVLRHVAPRAGNACTCARAIDKCRADATRWWPWLSRLATVVALVHTRQGLQLAKEYAAAQVQVLGVRP